MYLGGKYSLFPPKKGYLPGINDHPGHEAFSWEKTSMNLSDNASQKKTWKQFKLLVYLLGIFYSIAIILWLILGKIFYLVNFVWIGSALGLGLGLWPILPKKRRHLARKLSQLLIGGYMFAGLGIGLIYIFFGRISPENMQIEGFWFWLLAGQFAASVIHYVVAKIFGPVLFNRGWCGWACWTAAVLDLLPWKKSPGRKIKWEKARYIVFVTSAALVFVLVFGFQYTQISTYGTISLGEGTSVPAIWSMLWQIPELWWFLMGNLAYFSIGFILAASMKDNRAFCKYFCPISVFLKISASRSRLRLIIDREKCIQCKACERACSMDIKLLAYAEQRQPVKSTECILCLECVNACPKGAIGTDRNKIR